MERNMPELPGDTINAGQVAERLNAPVSKTGRPPTDKAFLMVLAPFLRTTGWPDTCATCLFTTWGDCK